MILWVCHCLGGNGEMLWIQDDVSRERKPCGLCLLSLLRLGKVSEKLGSSGTVSEKNIVYVLYRSIL